MKKTYLFLSSLVAAALTANAQVKINVGTADNAKSVSPMLYGIFFEDINHAADGGLYAELVSNRSFEDNENVAENWTATGGAQMRLTREKLLNKAQKQALEVTFTAKTDCPQGIANSGFWGMNIVQGRTYKLSFWAKGKLSSNLAVSLTNANGDCVYDMEAIEGKLTNKWQKFTATITATVNDPKGRMEISTDGKGIVTFDVVSLFPPTFKNRENGCRPDLADLLHGLRPTFMRFPGGCFVEGQESPDNAFRWQRTIGPIEERPGHLNRNWSYRTSDGMGFHEFLQLSEDLGAKPLYVVNIGLWHGGMTPVDSIQPWIDECMDALEYANGPVTSKFGAMRAANGHPEPFNIEYLEIGNENNQDDPAQQSDHYYDRYRKFKDAVLAKYPKMHLIGNVVAWGNDDPKWNSNEEVELLDEHYYRTPGWFAENFRKYDAYDRSTPKIYCGEYAVTNSFGTVGNLNAGLGEAVFMMGMENNSDHVVMSSYAPIFVNENNVAWQPDMIRFNSARVMCTPSYYVQKLMAENVGTKILKVDQQNPYPMVTLQMLYPDQFKVGYATWATNASFEFKSLTPQYTSIPSPLSSLTSIKGEWKQEGTIVRQTSDLDACVALATKDVKFDGGYTYKLRARKDKGAEGFMIVFNYQNPDNYCWLNLGGWGNTQHGIEQIIDGGKMQTATKPGRVEEGRWYDITITVDGKQVKCWLDDELLFDTELKSPLNYDVYSSATFDEKTGETIVKVVNTSSVSTTADISIEGKTPCCAKLIRLTSLLGKDENTIDNPTNVYPTTHTIFATDGKLNVEIPAYSLNIFRVK